MSEHFKAICATGVSLAGNVIGFTPIDVWLQRGAHLVAIASGIAAVVHYVRAGRR